MLDAVDVGQGGGDQDAGRTFASSGRAAESRGNARGGLREDQGRADGGRRIGRVSHPARIRSPPARGERGAGMQTVKAVVGVAGMASFLADGVHSSRRARTPEAPASPSGSRGLMRGGHERGAGHDRTLDQAGVDGARRPGPGGLWRTLGRRGQDAQDLQLVGLYRPPDPGRLHQGDRHQGGLRHLRFQRGAGDQGAYRRHRLRHRRPLQPPPAAPDRRRRHPAAGPGQAARTGRTCRRTSWPASRRSTRATATPSRTCGAPSASATMSTR